MLLYRSMIPAALLSSTVTASSVEWKKLTGLSREAQDHLQEGRRIEEPYGGLHGCELEPTISPDHTKGKYFYNDQMNQITRAPGKMRLTFFRQGEDLKHILDSCDAESTKCRHALAIEFDSSKCRELRERMKKISEKKSKLNCFPRVPSSDWKGEHEYSLSRQFPDDMKKTGRYEDFRVREPTNLSSESKRKKWHRVIRWDRKSNGIRYIIQYSGRTNRFDYLVEHDGELFRIARLKFQAPAPGGLCQHRKWASNQPYRYHSGKEDEWIRRRTPQELKNESQKNRRTEMFLLEYSGVKNDHPTVTWSPPEPEKKKEKPKKSWSWFGSWF